MSSVELTAHELRSLRRRVVDRVKTMEGKARRDAIGSMMQLAESLEDATIHLEAFEVAVADGPKVTTAPPEPEVPQSLSPGTRVLVTPSEGLPTEGVVIDFSFEGSVRVQPDGTNVPVIYNIEQIRVLSDADNDDSDSE